MREILCCLLVLSGLGHLMAQQVSTNKKGDLIITYRDGSWRPVKPSDSLLVKEYLLQNPSSKSAKSKTKPTKSDTPEQPMVSPAASTPIPVPAETTPGSLENKWKELVYNISEEEKSVQKEFRDATNAQFKAAEALKQAKAEMKSTDPQKIVEYQHQYDASVANLREAKLRQNDIKKLVDATRNISSNPASLNDKKYKKTLAGYNTFQTEHHPKTIPTQPVEAPVNIVTEAEPTVTSTAQPVPAETSPTPQNTGKVAKSVVAAQPGKRPDDPKMKAYKAEPYACVFVTDSMDHSGNRRLELRPEVFLTYTDPDLRPYFRDKEMITSRGMVSKVGPFSYLSVEFQIAGSHAQNNFGSLQEGSLLSIKLIQGESVSLYNLKTNTGRIDAFTGNTIYIGQYALGKQELKKLAASEIDSIRVLWSTGYEDYEVFAVDFLMNQIQCILSKK